MTAARSQRAQKCDQILFFLRRQLGADDQVEELDGVFQCQETLVVHVGRVILHAAQCKSFDRPIMLLIITGLKKRSVRRSCIRLSV